MLKSVYNSIHNDHNAIVEIEESYTMQLKSS